MGHVVFAVLFVVLPIGCYVLVRSITWVVAAVTGTLALAGTLVTFAIDQGVLWTWTGLQFLTAGALLVVLVAAFLVRRGRPDFVDVPWKRQLATVIGPVAVGLAFLLAARLIAAPRAGLFTAVGFIVQRQSAEDNAKWLDFSGQLVTGHQVVQGVPMGGPLQLFMVIMCTMLAAVSMVAFGGVNEVFVASNAVVYAEFVLAAFAPFALAPLAEARVRVRAGASERNFIPAPLIWTGILVLVVGSLAVSGLGHLTLQFVFQVVTFWVCVFLVGTRVRHAYTLSSLTLVAVAVVWFPLTPISVIVLVAGAVLLGRGVIRAHPKRRAPWLASAMWLAMIVLSWTSFSSSLRYMSDMSTTNANGSIGGGGGGVRASVGALAAPALDLLTSQGGTQVIAPAVGVLVVLSSVLGTIYVARRRRGQTRYRILVAFAPAVLLGGYALVLSVLGTWWAGSGPAYGALKTTYLASIVLLAVSVPFALLELDRRRAGTTLVRIAGIVGVIYLLTIDGLMPHAFTYISPQQWPTSTGDDRGYWWPAEVREVADQSIADAPIACAYYPPRATVPSALPNGQTAYSCTRMLVGLSGADTTGQPLPDWLRREWLNNQAAWLEEWPNLAGMPEDVRLKKFILMDEVDRVVGLESVQSFLDREKPDWAK